MFPPSMHVGGASSFQAFSVDFFGKDEVFFKGLRWLLVEKAVTELKLCFALAWMRAWIQCGPVIVEDLGAIANQANQGAKGGHEQGAQVAPLCWYVFTVAFVRELEGHDTETLFARVRLEEERW
ncbi:hypothetical protein NCU17161 [Neurospora crassa OR74A]|uniref:Uncharacterized protein n=1 Tax=Neurospora crassa (strain ATCC 24698 / 74-OR23-1A / CBS 708.71 / DSM 1257 / FGSC 987) TaxID=367110 RepID=V5IKB5_NEUCR|nr:hypothetical protein NCU17161 [Neurospora crassa OR74A]ESA41808.1 hypothetical protein NCU17161 [Neurospora crassa OR74A]|eukprot:XP_011395347.1 hypothetical protein NCU17161 [Neurospora crassa OR74A]